MEIGPVSNDQTARSADQADKKRKIESSLTEKKKPISDSVEISSDARARLAEAADKKLNEINIEVTASKENSDDENIDRLEEIRNRIENGFYNQPGVKSIVAKKLLLDINPDNSTEKKL